MLPGMSSQRNSCGANPDKQAPNFQLIRTQGEQTSTARTLAKQPTHLKPGGPQVVVPEREQLAVQQGHRGAPRAVHARHIREQLGAQHRHGAAPAGRRHEARGGSAKEERMLLLPVQRARASPASTLKILAQIDEQLECKRLRTTSVE